MKMVITFPKSRLIISLVLLVLLSLACSENKDSQQTETSPEPIASVDSTYQNWKSVSYNNLKLKYPADHEESGMMYDYAKKFDFLLKNDCAFLNLPLPIDTLTFFMFNTVAEGRATTGEMFPFYRGDSIYYWPPYTYGTALAEYLINKWAKTKTRFPFLTQGLMRLFDASGRNFHLMTLDYIDSNMFKSLDELAVDTTINANIEKYRSVLAASFVDFVNYKYDQAHFALLYHSPANFDSSVVGIFRITTDSLQKEWINTIKSNYKR